jgi:hypothetical protein
MIIMMLQRNNEKIRMRSSRKRDTGMNEWDGFEDPEPRNPNAELNILMTQTEKKKHSSS